MRLTGVAAMRILGPPSATWETVRANLVRLGATALFLDTMAPTLWREATAAGVDPVGVVAQSYKETGGGRFGGKVKPEFYNTAGIKVRHQNLFPELSGDNPLAHAMFPNWDIGARAHVEHLLAYAGVKLDRPPVDPRYVYVVDRHWCESFADLGGKWAPSATYGTELVAVANRLREGAAP